MMRTSSPLPSTVHTYNPQYLIVAVTEYTHGAAASLGGWVRKHSVVSHPLARLRGGVTVYFLSRDVLGLVV